MVLGLYLIGKVFTSQVLLKPSEVGLLSDYNSHNALIVDNLKIIASMLYWVFFEYVVQMTEHLPEEGDLPYSDKISRLIYS